MLPKYHEEDDIFALEFLPAVSRRPDLKVTIPVSSLWERRQVRFIAPSKNLDRRCAVMSIEKIREDTGHLDIVQANYID